MTDQPTKGRDGRPLRARGAGTTEFRNGHHWVKVSLPDKTRPRFALCGRQPLVGGKCATCDGMSDALVADRAQAISERKRREFAEQLAREEKDTRQKRLTVQQLGDLWTSGKLFKSYGEVNGLKEKATAKDDEYRLKRYVYPVIGAMLAASITEEDIQRVMREAPKRARVRNKKQVLRPASKFQLYQVMRRLFDLAIMPCKLRSTSPVQPQIRPRKGGTKLYAYLYPSELLALLKCPTVPIERRVLYALAVYTGLRKGSLYALGWNGVDFEHRTLMSLQSKTGLPQLFEIPQSLAELLGAWFEYQRRPKGNSALVPEPTERKEREAELLREDLMTAGIERHEPPEDAPENVQPLRFHDLRATFVTWAMREGRGDGWISDRTGHLTPEMRARYARAARTLADLQYEPFPDISGAIPELVEARDNVRSIAAARAKR